MDLTDEELDFLNSIIDWYLEILSPSQLELLTCLPKDKYIKKRKELSIKVIKLKNKINKIQ